MRRTEFRRKGAIYLIVLASTALVTLMGLGALHAVRVQRRTLQVSQDWAAARLHADSAVELGLLTVARDPNWRTTQPHGTWIADQAWGRGAFNLEGIDPQDGDLTDSDEEPLVLTGIGTQGIARCQTQVTLVPVIKPLEALNTCMHASGKIAVFNHETITLVGAPLSTNGKLDNKNIIDGDAEAVTVKRVGTITGDLTTPIAPKAMPASNVIADYLNKATTIPFTGDIEKVVLTPSYNPWGASNPAGVYVVYTHGSNLRIKNARIWGTLIVVTGGRAKLRLEEALCLQPYRSDYPTLIVDGEAEIKLKSGEMILSEATHDTNFNPPGAPYQGQMDDDTLDEYPNEIHGLIHVTKFLHLNETARIVGVVIGADKIHCHGDNVIVHDPDLYIRPPVGYTFVERMKVSPGSYQRIVD